MKLTRILIGQSNSDLLGSFGKPLKEAGFDVSSAQDGDQILEVMEGKNPPDLLILEDTFQDPDASQICRTLKSNPDHSRIPILILAPGKNSKGNDWAIESGCDDLLVEPILVEVVMARVRSLIRLKLLTDELDDAESVLFTLTRTMEAKDRYTLGHADRVSNYAIELGRHLGMSGRDIDLLRKGAKLHDLGKIAVPDAILTKPGKYTPEEFAIMKRHPVLGCEICKKLRSVKEVLPLIRHHHEKLDGSGYPDGISGDQINPLIRVVTIVDIYDALRSKRSYKDAFPINKSFTIMWEEADKGWWDKSILSAWEKLVRARASESFRF